jgi:hypothetical protein
VRSHSSSDVIDAAQYSVEELRQAVFEGQGRLARPLALALLTRKDYPEKVNDLQRVLTAEGEQPRLRVIAANALGEMQTPQALRALDRGLQSSDSVTLRGVVKALGNIGTRSHIPRLEGLAGREDPVGREAQRAIRTLGQRLKTGPGRAVAPIRTLPLSSGDERAAISVGRPDARELAAAVASAPLRRLAQTNAMSMTCQGRSFVLVLDEDAAVAGLDLFKRGGELGIVAEPRQVEGTGWEHRYTVSVEPAAAGRFTALVTTHDGRLVYAGEGAVAGEEAGFQLEAVDRPGALPVDIRGRFDGRRLVFDQAFSATRRRPPRLPTLERGQQP